MKKIFFIVSISIIGITRVTADGITDYGTAKPDTDTSYYLYDLTKNLLISNNGEYGSAGLAPTNPVTFTLSCSDDHYLLANSVDTGYFKSGKAGNGYLWFDGKSTDSVSFWYITAVEKSCRLDVGQYDNGDDKPLRSAATKYYLYYNSSALAFTTDVSQADSFIFIKPEDYNEILEEQTISDTDTQCKVSTNDSVPVHLVVNRTLSTEHLNTLVLPIDLNAEEFNTVFGANCTAYYLSGISGGGDGSYTLTFYKATTLVHGWPILVKPDSSAAWNGSTYTFIGKIINTEEQEQNNTCNPVTFTGTYVTEKVGKGDFFVKKDSLYKSKGESIIGATHAYFSIASESEAKELTLNIGEEQITTTVGAFNKNVIDDNFYRIDGRKINLNANRVNSMPKGIYIINNKKVIIK